MSQPKFLRVPDVLARTRLSRASLHRRVKDGTFPTPVRIGVRTIAWLAPEIDEWERGVIAKRDARLAAKASA
ncbi:AlpA family transcriptional regulator [Methylocystis sp.]|uniref:helix-turn-helix transcriptional regulator n=1 Tax=Methylocystis sp. TaxID=1911079 RepID=UPI0025CFE5DE|nr:AlpA family phage regulatory protein [Methylocystis sp.]